MDKYLQANRALWDEWTGINYRSDSIRLRPSRPAVTALATSDLRVEFLHEFTFCEWPVSFLLPGGDGRYRLPPELDGALPLFFSLRASKPPAAV